MNTSLQLNSQFQKIIREKTENYVDRPLISTIINNFLQKHNHGYFTLIGSPGSGKSAILANYTIQNPQTVYYSAEVEGKNRADEFLITLCTQLTQKIDNQNPSLEGQTWERGDGRRQNLPPSLEVYYQSLWEKMAGNGLSEIELGVLKSFS